MIKRTSASSSRHQHWNRHWHRHCKTIIFAIRNWNKKQKKVYLCFFLCLALTLVSFCYKYLFLHDFLFIHQKAFIDIWTFGSIRRKNNRPKHFYILTSETPMVEFFLSTLVGLPEIFPKSSLEQLFCRESFRGCFCKNELHSTREFSRILKTQGKARGCNLKTCNLL